MVKKFYILFFLFLILPSQYSYSGGQGGMGGNHMAPQGPPGKYVQGLAPVTPAGQRGQHPMYSAGRDGGSIPGGSMDPEFMEEQQERNEKSRKKGGGYGGFNGGGPPGQGGYVDCEMYNQQTCGMHMESCYWDQMEIECERIKPGQGGMHNQGGHGAAGGYPPQGGHGNGYGTGGQRNPPPYGQAPATNNKGRPGQGYNQQSGGHGGAPGYGGAGAQQKYGGQSGGAYGNQGYPSSTGGGYGGSQGRQPQGGSYGGRPYILSQSKFQTINPKKTKTYIEEHIMYNPWFWGFIFNCVVLTLGITLYGLRTQNKFQLDQLLRYQEA